MSTIRRAWTWLQSHPLAADTGLAVAVLVAALYSSFITKDLLTFDPTVDLPSTLEAGVAVTATIAPLALRRRAPLGVLLVCVASFILARNFLDAVETSIVAIALSLAVYSAAAHGRRKWRDWICAICLIAVMADLTREVFSNVPADVPNLLSIQIIALLLNLALFSAMWGLGAALGAGRRRAAELLERTVALEHEREENARRAVFDERVRIARELHDMVAHHVSVMGVQAGAARVVMGRDPAQAAEALASIEASSRQGVVELHRLLGFLRQEGDPDDLSPQPGLAQLPKLAASMGDSELTVDVSVEGEKRLLPPTIDVSAFRIVQEALTNTLKHARASRADVNLRYWPDELEIEVVDDGRGDTGPSPSPGGLGLIGMRERTALHGGRFTAGKESGGGFAVRVRLPTPEGGL